MKWVFNPAEGGENEEEEMKLEIVIEKLDDDVIIPLTDETGLQMRHDGILLNGKFHLWEEIMFVTITNRELLDKLKKRS